MITQECTNALSEFRRQLDRFHKISDTSKINVRLITRRLYLKYRSPTDGGPGSSDRENGEQIVASFTAELSPGLQTKTMAEQITNRLLPSLNDIVRFVPEKGNRPHSKLARWWGMNALDAMSRQKIALSESQRDPNGVDEGAINRAFSRAGI